jgi:hypothetical protein
LLPIEEDTWNPIEIDADILVVLLEAPNCILQKNTIKKAIETKYVKKKYTTEDAEGVFHTVFTRAIKRLCSDELLKKDNRGHQSVFYSIPEEIRADLRIKLQKINNVKIFTRLDVDEQQRLLVKVSKLEGLIGNMVALDYIQEDARSRRSTEELNDASNKNDVKAIQRILAFDNQQIQERIKKKLSDAE